MACLMNLSMSHSSDQHRQRVLQGLKQKISSSSLHAFYYTFLAEQEAAFQTLFDFAVYVFQNQRPVDKDYGHPAVIGMSQGQASGPGKASYGGFCAL